MVYNFWSEGRYWANPNAPLVRGTIETFNTGSVCSSNQPTRAWPASWKATVFLSFESSEFGFSIPTWWQMYTRVGHLSVKLPAITRSMARSKWLPLTTVPFSLAARRAASLQILAISAPTYQHKQTSKIFYLDPLQVRNCRHKYNWFDLTMCQGIIGHDLTPACIHALYMYKLLRIMRPHISKAILKSSVFLLYAL